MIGGSQRLHATLCRTLARGVVTVLTTAVAVAGCSSGGLAIPTNSPVTQSDCGRTPGTAGTWRPGLGYCEF